MKKRTAALIGIAAVLLLFAGVFCGAAAAAENVTITFKFAPGEGTAAASMPDQSFTIKEGETGVLAQLNPCTFSAPDAKPYFIGWSGSNRNYYTDKQGVMLKADAYSESTTIILTAQWAPVTQVTQSDFVEGVYAIPGNGYYQLTTESDTVNGRITIGDGENPVLAVLDLNGKTLDANKTESVVTNKGVLTLVDSVGGGKITGGRATYGGGVYVDGGTLTMNDCTISGNSAKDGGGGVYVDNCNTFTMTNCTISHNEVEGEEALYANGGGVYVDDCNTFTMTNCTISDNHTGESGGGIYFEGSTFTMNDSTISENSSTTKGGGVYFHGSTFTMNGGYITDNSTGENGGGVYVDNSGMFTMTNCTISGNMVEKEEALYANGGGVYVDGCNTFTMTNCTISDNLIRCYEGCYGLGGGISVDCVTCTMDGGTISRNEVNSDEESLSYGGGIHVESGELTMNDCTISDNLADYGGGVYVNNDSIFIMTNSTITRNTASSGEDDKGKGGGVYNNGTFTMNSGSISDNKSENDGGGVFNNGTFTMTSGYITDNNTSDGNGGGVYNQNTFSVSGNPVIKDNKVDRDANNVSLSDGKKITVTGDFSGEIYVNNTTGGFGEAVEKYNGALNFIQDEDNSIIGVWGAISEEKYPLNWQAGGEKHQITILPAEPKIINPSVSSAAAGAFITLTPALGYTVTSVSSDDVTITKSEDIYQFDMPDKDVTITAAGSANTYTVTLDAQGGTGGTGNITATYDSATHDPAAITNPQKTLHRFNGWYTSPADGDLVIDTNGSYCNAAGYVEGGVWKRAKDTTLYAQWAAPYTITFDAAGGTPTPASQQIPAGGKVSVPTGVTKTGYSIEGWYNGDNKWNFDTDTVSGSMTLTAKWTLKAPVISGDGTTTYGTSKTLTAKLDSGITPASYQWYLNNTAIGGATESTYTTPADLSASTTPYAYTVTVTVSDETSAPSAAHNLTVNKAANTITNLTIENWTYGETAKTPTATATDGTPYFRYSNSASGPYAETVPTDAGTHYVKAYVAESDNYKAGESSAVPFTIAKAANTITDPTISGWVYGGTPVAPSATATHGKPYYKYSVSESGTYSPAVPTAAGTYYVKAYVAESDNYKAAESANAASFTISQKEVGITWSTTTALPYTGSPQAPAATAANLVGSDVVTVTVTGKETNVGGPYTATADSLAGAAAGNYKLPATKPTQTFSITAKPLSACTVASIPEQTYTGSPITPAVTVKNGSTTLVKDTDYTVSYSDNTNVGTATVTITAKGTNYTGSTSTTFRIVIPGHTVTYDGNGNTSGTAPAPQLCEIGKTIDIAGPGTLAKEGYTFLNWNTEADGSGKSCAVGETVELTADLTFYAQWQEDEPVPEKGGEMEIDKDVTTNAAEEKGITVTLDTVDIPEEAVSEDGVSRIQIGGSDKETGESLIKIIDKTTETVLSLFDVTPIDKDGKTVSMVSNGITMNAVLTLDAEKGQRPDGVQVLHYNRTTGKWEEIEVDGWKETAPGVFSLTFTAYDFSPYAYVLKETHRIWQFASDFNIDAEYAIAGKDIAIKPADQRAFYKFMPEVHVEAGLYPVELGEDGNYHFSMPAESVMVMQNPIYHNITVTPTEKGTIVIQTPEEEDKASYDDTVFITVTPIDGYKVKSVEVKAGEERIPVELKDGKYQFTMPASDVTVSAAITRISSGNQGSSIWATPEATETPTPTPTETPAPDMPTVKPVTTETPTGKSPAPFMGLLAGLGAAAVVAGLRRR